jgi:hypothetical protein
MVETFRKHWPSEVDLVVYEEGFQIEPCERVTAATFPEWFLAWKGRHQHNAGAHGRDPRRNRQRPGKREYDFKQDCVKFAHKVAALTDLAQQQMTDGPSDILIWMDADTITHAKVTSEWIGDLLTGDTKEAFKGYMAWLDRQRLYPECGFLMFNARHARHLDFMRRLQWVYETDRVLQMDETHDSYVIQQTVLSCVREGWFPEPRSLSGEARVSHHPFPLCELGSRLDHAKGARKAVGRTPMHEIAGKRTEGHWR